MDFGTIISREILAQPIPDLEVLDNLTCIICYGILYQPVECETCEKLICGHHLPSILQSTKKCPQCRATPIKVRQPHRIAKMLLGKLRLTCNCGTELGYQELGGHQFMKHSQNPPAHKKQKKYRSEQSLNQAVNGQKYEGPFIDQGLKPSRGQNQKRASIQKAEQQLQIPSPLQQRRARRVRQAEIFDDMDLKSQKQSTRLPIFSKNKTQKKDEETKTIPCHNSMGKKVFWYNLTGAWFAFSQETNRKANKCLAQRTTEFYVLVLNMYCKVNLRSMKLECDLGSLPLRIESVKGPVWRCQIPQERAEIGYVGAINDRIEESFSSLGRQSLKIYVKEKEYEINFTKMQQINVITGFKRSITRSQY